jgi:hypothetical protein
MAKKPNPFAKMMAKEKLPPKGMKPKAAAKGAKKPNPFKKGKPYGSK